MALFHADFVTKVASGILKFAVNLPVTRQFAVEMGSRLTAPTASHPRIVLSVERRSAKWRGVGRFQVSTDTTSEQTEPGIGLHCANSENFLWVSGW